MLILNRRQMQNAEAAADKAGTSYETLMENAGSATAQQLQTGGAGYRQRATLRRRHRLARHF